MLDILAESADSVADWRQRIRAALGQNGQLIVDLIPQVELVIGPQPPVPELSLGEAEIRLRMVLRQFVGAFATREHPLTLFLDDLQWADPASLKLLVDLVAHPSTRHLLVIGAYRDNEVGPAHPADARAGRSARAGGGHPDPRAWTAAGSTRERARRRHGAWLAPGGGAARPPGAREDRRQPLLRHPVPDHAAPRRA